MVEAHSYNQISDEEWMVSLLVSIDNQSAQMQLVSSLVIFGGSWGLLLEEHHLKWDLALLTHCLN